MTRYINRTVVGYDQFLTDYVAVTHYRTPNLERVLEEHAMEHLRSIRPEQFPTTHIPPFTRIYGKRERREFTFVFQWNESTERFDIQYTGFALEGGEVEFFDTKFERWDALETDYQKQAKKGHAINFDDLKYDVFKRLAGKNGNPEHGKMCKVWLQEANSKSGSRCWFRFLFLMEDNAPVIRYEGYGVLELKAYAVADIRFERWSEFEAYAKNLLKPEHIFNFDELKEGLAKHCPINAESSYSLNIWAGGDKTISRRGYRFWFECTNEDGTPRIRYTRYSFS